MDKEEFEKLVSDGYDQLPEWVRAKIKNVALLIEDEPSEEVRKTEGLGQDETLLGYYQGIPLTARGDVYGVGVTMPDTITIYQHPIEHAAADDVGDGADDEAYKNAVRKEVADTIWHEFAHHFGMDEHEVRAREQGRK